MADYLNKKMLRGLGYTFNPDKLESFELDCYNFIANEFSKLEAKDLKGK